MITKIKNKKNYSINKEIILTRFLAVVLLILGLFLAFSNIQMARRRNELLSQSEKLADEIDRLQKTSDDLTLINDISGTQDYIEKQARENFQLQKPGEKVIAIIPAQDKKENDSENNQESWWQSFLKKLGF